MPNCVRDASGLVTNMQKTEIFPIQCHNVDLTDLLGEQQKISHFPCTYLGLPLHFRKLPKAAVQPIVQKIGGRLPGWKRNYLSYPGRETLVKSVLTATPTYFITVYKLPKWAIKLIDRYRRSFLWKGDDPEKVRGGHCLVKWKICLRPKKWGGLGIKDLEKFGRALRLRWLWHNWDPVDRPWKRLLKMQDQTDRQLFFASTYITIGDGKNTPFWESRWINGASPKELAPNLYMQARYKYRTVHKELQNDNWIRNLKNVNSEDLLQEFIMLFILLKEVTLTDQKDQIFWRWNGDGKYSAASAYEAQFVGAMQPFPTERIWKARTEPKCRFFAWLAMHGKILTADNLAKRNWQHEPDCSLCHNAPETADHILTQCNFTKDAWKKVASILNLQPPLTEINATGVQQCLEHFTANGSNKAKNKIAGILFFFWWQVWKERNRRIFEQKECFHHQVATLTADQVRMFGRAYEDYIDDSS